MTILTAAVRGLLLAIAFHPFTCVHGTISNPSVALSPSPNAGETVDAVTTFTTGTLIPAGGDIVVYFPSAFSVNTATMSAVSGIDSSSSVVCSTANARVTITLASSAPPATISFTLDGITLPGSGTTSPYSILTKDAAGVALESVTIAGSSIASTNLPAATVSTAPSPAMAGVTTAYTVILTTGIPLPIGSLIELEFPLLPASKFNLVSATLTSKANIDAASTFVQVLSRWIRLTVAGQSILANTVITLTYSNIINPAAQATGYFTVRTYDSLGAIYQDKTDVTGLLISSTTLLPSTVSVAPALYFGGMTTSYTVTFANTAYLPVGSRIALTFPPRFGISGAVLASVRNMVSTNTVLTLTTTTAIITTGAAAVTPGSGRSFTLSGIINPGSSCDQFIVEYCTTTWETYTFSLYDSGGNPFEQAAGVTGTPIVKKPLPFGRVRPALKDPNIVTTATVIFTTGATVPLTGQLEVEFPAGYTVDPMPTVSRLIGISGVSGSPAVSGLRVSLTVSGFIVPTSNLSFTLSFVTTPPLFTVGSYVVRTRDTQGSIIEESVGIFGEGCMRLNDCNGHGQCTLLATTCLCDSGWGAPSDVASYRSPDCTTRVCPSGYSWNAIPTATDTAHDQLEECSGMGLCDRTLGRCVCFDGFAGAACDRMSCPNACSGHGRCSTMREMAVMKNALPLSAPTSYTGKLLTSTWDESRIVGCVCDSSWAVGTGSGEVQMTEYFGADCSKRHCPTGDDPDTTVDETNCAGKTTAGGYAVGATGNRCHVECSNRGICNYRLGICTCFPGYTGFACQNRDALSK